MPSSPPPLAAALDDAIRRVRELAGDPLGAVAVLTPTRANAQLAFRAHASAFPSIRVAFEPADALIERLGRHALRGGAVRVAPTGFVEAAIRAALDSEPPADDPIAATRATVRLPVWLPALAGAVDALERAGVGAAEVAALPDAVDPLRRDLIAFLLRAVAAAREAAGVCGDGGAARAAQALLASGADLPEHLAVAGVVTLGDGALSRASYDALRALFGRVPVVHAAVPPFDALPAAPLGLRAAAPGAPIVHAAAAAGALALGALQRGEACALDGSVVFAATADEAREIAEAVRVVKRAIASGTPLDRIAIALPDAATVGVLAAALDRAHIDATWLVGPPLAQTPPGRLLAAVLELPGGAARAPAWYALLKTPGLPRSPLLAPLAPTGRARWRRLLGEANAAPDTRALLAELARVRERVAASPVAIGSAEDLDGADGPAVPPSPEARERELAAVTSLHGAIAAIQSLADGLPAVATLEEHARAWRAALDALVATPTPASRQIERVLDGFGGAGPPLGADAARALLLQTLGARQALEGAVADPAIRVVPPMALLGADVDVVCVLGLNEGRLPRTIEDDPLLPDALIAALDAGRAEPRLVPAAALADAERRRFAAAVSAARRELWLSTPRSDLLEARPAVPSALLLDALATLRGERVGYADLERVLVPTGGRDVFHPPEARDAISASEALLARTAAGRAAAGGPAATAGALDAVRTHPWAGRVARLYRAIDRLHRPLDGEEPVVDAWTGRLDAPGLAHPADGAGPVAARVLAQAIADQGSYLATHLLGAWRPRWLSDPGLASGPWTVSRWVVEAIARAAAASPDAPEAGLAAALDAIVAEERALAGDADAAEVAVARALAEAQLARITDRYPDLVPGPPATFAGASLTDGVPWCLAGAGSHAGAGQVVAWSRERSRERLKAKPERALAAGLEALALERASGEPTTAVARASDGDEVRAPGSADVSARVSRAWARVAAGVWLADGDLALHRERPPKDAPPSDRLEVLAAACLAASTQDQEPDA
ncbi:MAG: hypothetical protein H6745_15115 [Deltaproteobacteria bacterium]|nr:hypothetical protein [Deltaproteobacteria bacterium]